MTWLKVGALVCFVILIIAGIAGINQNQRQADPKAPTAAPAKDDAAKAAEEDRWKVMLGAASVLRKSMRNPDSFVIEQALQMDDGAVCFTYRSQNGFGGMNREKAVLSPKADKFLSSSEDGFHSLWNRECAGHVGTDKASTLMYAFGMIDDK